jgi:hypothetical protein
MSYTPGPVHSLQDARLRQKRIGKALSQVYAAMVSEEPPQAFLELLAQADRVQRNRAPQPMFS